MYVPPVLVPPVLEIGGALSTFRHQTFFMVSMPVSNVLDGHTIFIFGTKVFDCHQTDFLPTNDHDIQEASSGCSYSVNMDSATCCNERYHAATG